MIDLFYKSNKMVSKKSPTSQNYNLSIQIPRSELSIVYIIRIWSCIRMEHLLKLK